ncbi:hypothetical protein BDP27DRAFT_328340 [Rhodocollybia butyracea]|uniref:Uncharacterized protein n=1 Tax=Rhodocollybia butyracea TaxID=206335 RepID=A0A9P5TZH4_9AGAR|nr:hypothetical protein BDP27DRAFT_328340 [Rhodocollybia butyracea]
MSIQVDTLPMYFICSLCPAFFKTLLRLYPAKADLQATSKLFSQLLGLEVKQIWLKYM